MKKIVFAFFLIMSSALLANINDDLLEAALMGNKAKV